MKPFFLVLMVVLVAAGTAVAYNGWEARIPNGGVNTCNNCHLTGDFRADFKANGNQWTEALALKDSDGDGYTNGIELQDPYGVWEPGKKDPSRPGWDTYNPDDPNSIPPYDAVEPESWGRVKATFR